MVSNVAGRMKGMETRMIGTENSRLSFGVLMYENAFHLPCARYLTYASLEITKLWRNILHLNAQYDVSLRGCYRPRNHPDVGSKIHMQNTLGTNVCRSERKLL